MSSKIETKPYPKGCTITNLRQGEGPRCCFIYADLIAPNGTLLISATLDYINEKLVVNGVEKS